MVRPSWRGGAAHDTAFSAPRPGWFLSGRKGGSSAFSGGPITPEPWRLSCRYRHDCIIFPVENCSSLPARVAIGCSRPPGRRRPGIKTRADELKFGDDRDLGHRLEMTARNIGGAGIRG